MDSYDMTHSDWVKELAEYIGDAHGFLNPDDGDASHRTNQWIAYLEYHSKKGTWKSGIDDRAAIVLTELRGADSGTMLIHLESICLAQRELVHHIAVFVLGVKDPHRG